MLDDHHQSRNLIDYLTPLENIRLVNPTATKEILLQLGLEERLDAEIGLLSGGQRQAVSLLMATLRTPELLLLDEHTAALDPKTQRKIMQFLYLANGE